MIGNKRQRFAMVLLVGLMPFVADAAPAAAPASPSKPPGSASPIDTADAIEGGVLYLASVQKDDGSWSLADGGSPIGVTGYALVALLDAGRKPGDGPQGATVTRAVEFLTRSQRDDGNCFSPAPGRWPHTMYDHASATVALARAAKITRDPALKIRVNKAANFIVSCQDPSGGWRYKPVAQDPPDLPVSAAQICALCCARDAGADIPKPAMDGGVAYLLRCRDPQTGGFGYTPNGHNPGFARTAVALCALEAAGTRPDDGVIKSGLDILFQSPGPREIEEQGHWFAYGRYYAAQSANRAGDDTRTRWAEHVRGEVLRQAHRDGAFIRWEDPRSVPPDPAYHTALNITILVLCDAVPGAKRQAREATAGAARSGPK
jgi:hypothetical protein